MWVIFVASRQCSQLVKTNCVTPVTEIKLKFYRDDDRDQDGGEESPAWDLTVRGPGAVLRLQRDEDRQRVQNGEPPMHNEVRSP